MWMSKHHQEIGAREWRQTRIMRWTLHVQALISSLILKLMELYYLCYHTFRCLFDHALQSRLLLGHDLFLSTSQKIASSMEDTLLLAWLDRAIAFTKARSIVLRAKYPGLHRRPPKPGVISTPRHCSGRLHLAQAHDPAGSVPASSLSP